jgi:hypothetical protein
MKKQTSKQYALFGLIVAAGVIAVASIALAGRSSVGSLTSSNAKSTNLPSGSIESQEPRDSPPGESEVKDLVDRSSTILVGTVVSNICRLSADKETVNTNYTLRVSEVLKGTVHRDSAFVSMPGGMVMLQANGSEVTEKNPLKGLKQGVKVSGGDKVEWRGGSADSKFTPPIGNPMVDGKTYLLFLKNDPEKKSRFILTNLSGSSQSSYEVQSEGMPSQLIEDIRRAVAMAAAQ